MNKNIEKFENDVMVVEETIKTFEAILTEAGKDGFQHSLNALREIDDNTFNKFKSVVEVLYTMSRTENTATFSSAFSAVAFEDTSVADNLFSSIIPTTGLLTTFNEYERQAEADAFKSESEAPTKEDLLDVAPAEEEIVKPEPLHVPDEGVFVYAIPDNFRCKFERVFYYPRTGKFFGEYSGELQPKTYSNGIMCVYIKKFTHKWEEFKTKLVFVREILDKCGAMPLPKVANEGKWVLSFANGNRLDFRLSNLLWTHGTGRTKMSGDEEYLKRIIRDALYKLGSDASVSSVFNFLNKEKEVISAHMVGKLLPIVKNEVREKEEEMQEAIKAYKILDIANTAVEESSKTDVMEYISKWKKLFKHYPSKENIADIRKYLTEQGYINDDFSVKAVKDTIKLLTGISLSLKDLV